jgi:signal transduction histidine kinase
MYLPYLEHQLKTLTLGCMIWIAVVVIIGEFVPPLLPYPPDIIVRIVRSSTTIGVLGLLLVLLSQVKTHLTTMLFSQMQSQIRATQAQEANLQKSYFLAQMSHELRTPLNGINPILELLLLGVYGELNADQRDCVQRSFNSSQHLLSVINNVLDLSKIEAGHMEVQFAANDVASLCNEPIAILASQAEQKQLTLKIDVQADLPAIWCDRQMIKQVLLNLVSNAINFTRSGSVTVSATAIQSDAIRIAVSDTGLGIAEENQALIFEAFRQVRHGSDRQNKGSGLGLTITKQMVELNRGEISLYSTPGIGSSFFITLPSVKTIAARVQRFAAIESAATIGLINADVLTHQMLGALLNRAGLRMLSIFDAKEAIAVLERQKPDILIVDLAGAGVTSHDIISRIRNSAHPELNSTPIIVCTADNQLQTLMELRDVEYVLKPIQERELILKIKDTLAGNTMYPRMRHV